MMLKASSMMHSKSLHGGPQSLPIQLQDTQHYNDTVEEPRQDLDIQPRCPYKPTTEEDSLSSAAQDEHQGPPDGEGDCGRLHWHRPSSTRSFVNSSSLAR